MGCKGVFNKLFFLPAALLRHVLVDGAAGVGLFYLAQKGGYGAAYGSLLWLAALAAAKQQEQRASEQAQV